MIRSFTRRGPLTPALSPSAGEGEKVRPDQDQAMIPPLPRRGGEGRGEGEKFVAPRCARWLVKAGCFLTWLLATMTPVRAGVESSLPEYQIKALFLVNFTKYVQWPDAAWNSRAAPFVIGIVGENNFDGYLQRATEGKTVSSHPIALLQVEKEEDLARCHMLFVSASEKKRLSELLNQVKSAPVLTVGEAEQFAQRGGVIGFIRKEGKIRLQIDLNAARGAGLQISSKLLSVADSVIGKP